MKRLLLILFPALILLSSCHAPLTENELALGTICAITSYDKKDDGLIAPAFELIHSKEKLFDFYSEDSELGRVNSSAHISPVKVSEELYELIKLSYEIALASNEAFSPVLGPLVELWGIGTEDAHVPSDEEIEEALRLCNIEDLVLCDEDRTVFFRKEGMKIDLGAIAKGHVTNEVVSFLKENGVERSIVNLGGNLYLIGEKKKGECWTVGLQNPGADYGGYYATVDVRDSAVVTSGEYERYLELEDGTRYHHILDSRTGYPAKSDLKSASIISSDSALADALATACFVLGQEKAEALVKEYGVDAVFLTTSDQIVRVEGS